MTIVDDYCQHILNEDIDDEDDKTNNITKAYSNSMLVLFFTVWAEIMPLVCAISIKLPIVAIICQVMAYFSLIESIEIAWSWTRSKKARAQATDAEFELKL